MRVSHKPKLTLRLILAGTAATAAFLAVGPATAQGHHDHHEGDSFRATLMPLNHSGAEGHATLHLSPDEHTLTVNIKASGLEPHGPHVSHIHGLSSDGHPVESGCPTGAQDTDHDGFVELVEGQATYGPVLIDFMNIDPDHDGHVNFSTTIHLSGEEGALPLENRHIVIHGMTVGAVGAGTAGEVDGHAGYKTVLPVLCGEIEPANHSNALHFREVPHKH